jgi:hypothetical protein
MIRTGLVALAALLCWLYPPLLSIAVPALLTFLYQTYKEHFDDNRDR